MSKRADTDDPSSQRVATEAAIETAKQAAAKKAAVIIGDEELGNALGEEVAAEVAKTIAEKLGKELGGNAGADAGKDAGVEAARELAKQQVADLLKPPFEESKIQDLKAKMAEQAVAVAIEAGTLAGKGAGSHI